MTMPSSDAVVPATGSIPDSAPDDTGIAAANGTPVDGVAEAGESGGGGWS